jgi:holo-[acyl-carrier protein] synthase
VIIGIGVDVVDVSRFAATIDRVPRLVERLFAPQERDMPVQSLAARFAAKEAIAKALGSPGGLRWHDAVILRAPGRRPEVHVSGTVAHVASEQGIKVFHVSLSHDGPIATAMIVAEG